MKTTVRLRSAVDESQAEQLQKRIAALPFKLRYQEEQHGPLLLALIDCTPAQEKLVRDVLQDIGVAATNLPNEDSD